MQASAIRPLSTWRIMQYMHHTIHASQMSAKTARRRQHSKNNCKNGIKNDRESKSSGDVHDKWDLIADTERL